METEAHIEADAKPKRQRGRPAYISAAFELPLPPSANALWFNVPGRGRVRTDTYRAWLTEAGWELRELRAPTIAGSVGITICAGLSERARDLDNLVKPLCDLLQANAVLENDLCVGELFARWDKTVPTGRIRVEVRQVAHPTKRMSAELRERYSRERRGVRDWNTRKSGSRVTQAAEAANIIIRSNKP